MWRAYRIIGKLRHSHYYFFNLYQFGVDIDEEYAKTQINNFPERKAVAFVNDWQGPTSKVHYQPLYCVLICVDVGCCGEPPVVASKCWSSGPICVQRRASSYTNYTYVIPILYVSYA